MKPKEPLKLIPMDDLKKAVAAISHVPKSAIEKAAKDAKAPDYPAGRPSPTKKKAGRNRP